jgi:hypothetical protein
MPANSSHSEVPAAVTVIVFSMPWNLNRRHVKRVGLGLSAGILISHWHWQSSNRGTTSSWDHDSEVLRETSASDILSTCDLVET